MNTPTMKPPSVNKVRFFRELEEIIRAMEAEAAALRKKMDDDALELERLRDLRARLEASGSCDGAGI